MRESYFDGGLLQLIGTYILAGLLTTITLGIGLPWAVNMIYRWELKHTVINGYRMRYNGTGGSLFAQWIKWFLLTIITLGIYGFWVNIKLRKWKVSHTSFSGYGESYFDGTLLQLIGNTILASLMTIFTFGIAAPWAFTLLYRWEIEHTVIDGNRLIFDGTGIGLFGQWIKWFLLTIITFGIYGFWTSIKLIKWKTVHTHY